MIGSGVKPVVLLRESMESLQVTRAAKPTHGYGAMVPNKKVDKEDRKAILEAQRARKSSMKAREDLCGHILN